MSTFTSLPVPTFSSPLAEALSRFLTFKRAAGCRYHDEARALRLLDQFLTTTLDAHDPVITLDVVRRYVARRGEESETTRAHRLSLIPSGLPLSRALAAADGGASTAILGHSPPHLRGAHDVTGGGPSLSHRVRASGDEAVVSDPRHRLGHRLGAPCTLPDCGRAKCSG